MTSYEGYRHWKGWSSSPFGVCPHALAIYFDVELKSSGVESVAGSSILEIGFGNGEFARWACDAGANYVGTELLDDLVKKGEQAGFQDRDAAEPLDTIQAENSLDIVVAFDVFEHFTASAMRCTFRSVHQALRSGGRLIGRVPSGDSPFARALQHGDATHSLSIGSSMIRQLADEAGFAVYCIREPAFPLKGNGLKAFLRRSVVRGIRRVAFPMLTSAFIGGGQPVLSPNMVFVLVKA